MGTDVFVLGNYKNVLFGSHNFRSGVLFLRFSWRCLTFTPLSHLQGVSLQVDRVVTLIPHSIQVTWDALGSLFADHLVFFIMQGPLGPLAAMFCCFLGPLGPKLTLFSLHLYNISVDIFGLASFVNLFSFLIVSDVKAAATRTFSVLLCEKLGSLSLIGLIHDSRLCLFSHYHAN